MTARLRRTDVLAAIAPDGGEPTAASLCAGCRGLVPVTGAGITLMVGELEQATLCHSDGVSAVVEELQYTLGEGPCVDAFVQGRPVLEPDLAGAGMPRWPAFSPPAVDIGVRAVFGFPLEVGAIRIGALNLYRDRSGPLSMDEHADVLVVADVVTHAVLAMQANAPPGALAAELEDGSTYRAAVHQASGMVAGQLDIGVAEALARLRAFAYAEGRSVGDVADDVVQRRLRFEG